MADQPKGKMPSSSFFHTKAGASVRQRVQESLEQAHEEHRRELFKRRIDLARQGVRAYDSHRVSEAASAFHSYIHILEDWKGVPEGGLLPSHFASKEEEPELILLAGVFWDLVKLYDRTKSPEREKDFRHYLQKYIMFTKGMKYQALGAETLRKYISNEKPVHKEDFKAAYKMMTGSNCFIATSLIDVGWFETLPRLRLFRDSFLMQTGPGRAFIRFYYRQAPGWAARMDRWPEAARVAVARLLDVLAWVLARLFLRQS